MNYNMPIKIFTIFNVILSLVNILYARNIGFSVLILFSFLLWYKYEDKKYLLYKYFVNIGLALLLVCGMYIKYINVNPNNIIVLEYLLPGFIFYVIGYAGLIIINIRKKRLERKTLNKFK